VPPAHYAGPIATSGQIGDDTNAKTLVAVDPATRRKPTTLPPPLPTGATPLPPKLPATPSRGGLAGISETGAAPIATPSSVKIAGRDATSLNPPPTRIVRDEAHDQALQSGVDIGNRKLEETAKYEELERERTIKVTEAEKVMEDAQRELSTLEAQRRGLRDKRKELERRQSAYVKAAEQRDTEAGNAPLGETRGELRRLADGHRREAASLDPERQDLERRLAALERPISYAQSKVEQAKSEVDTQRRALADAREGHRHRQAELDAEASRKSREKDLIEGEINRRLVNLGTLINLHRVERPEFEELYRRIDRLRHAINARTTEIDRLTAEREAYDRGSLLRGYAVLGGIAVLLITFVVIILALV
jgi:hypothetical protein